MLRIERTNNGTSVSFRLSGRLEKAELAELDAQIQSVAKKDQIVLDLQDVTLVDLNAVNSLDRLEMDRIELINAPAYIRTWIESERERLRAEAEELNPGNGTRK